MNLIGDQYTIREFLPEETSLYKAMRLEALQLEAAMFGSSYAREAAFTDEQWLERIVNVNSVCLGLFCCKGLIGITGVVIDWNDTAMGVMVQSYIQWKHRGKGLSHLLYDARLAWARNRGLKCLRVGHRESNLPSKAANQHYDFKYTYREPCTWPDGSREDILYYDLEL